MANEEKNPAEQGDTGAIEQFQPLMDALGPKEVVRRTNDANLAATQILARAEELNKPELLERLATLPPKEWDIGCVSRAMVGARAILALTAKRSTVNVQSTSARIDAALAEESSTVRKRMMRLCKYHFGDDPVLGPELADIATGSGYLDTAQDLIRLAAIYSKNQSIVSTDRKHYVATDEKDALRLAERIQEEYDKAHSVEQKLAGDQVARAWTLLVRDYDQLRRAASFLFWGNDERLAEFGPPGSIGRRPSTRKATKTPVTPSAEDDAVV
ncbi:MAG: hypothetical protein WCI05_03170 [Myxococcales bacterium]